MNKPHKSPHDRWLDFASYQPRRDGEGQRTLEAGLELQRLRSTHHAATFLQRQGIGIDTALRVLTRPQMRR